MDDPMDLDPSIVKWEELSPEEYEDALADREAVLAWAPLEEAILSLGHLPPYGNNTI